MEKAKNKEKLSIQYFTRLKRIFDEKHWPIDDVFGENEFENFCTMLGELEQDQQELVLTLTENFLWISESDYLAHFTNAFASFIHYFDFAGKKNILICPLIPECDFGKSKSSIILFYLVKARICALQKKYSQYNIIMVDRPQNITCDKIRDTTILCLIDDYIGSGETAISATAYYLNQKYPMSQIALVTLVSMKAGLEYLQSLGYNIYTSIIENKGITGSGRNEEKESKCMHAIEGAIKVSSDYNFGYKQSEALVRMIRTPNNTFPIYWYRDKKKKINIYAPFPR